MVSAVLSCLWVEDAIDAHLIPNCNFINIAHNTLINMHSYRPTYQYSLGKCTPYSRAVSDSLVLEKDKTPEAASNWPCHSPSSSLPKIIREAIWIFNRNAIISVASISMTAKLMTNPRFGLGGSMIINPANAIWRALITHS